MDWNVIKGSRSSIFVCHTLRGCVDWNYSYCGSKKGKVPVTPCVGVWIETIKAWIAASPSRRHTLRGCVDWNSDNDRKNLRETVTPCVGVWIETLFSCFLVIYGYVTPCVGVWIETISADRPNANAKSHPAWVCGLKQHHGCEDDDPSNVTPCVGVWIETTSWFDNTPGTLVTPCVGVWIETCKPSYCH